MSEHTETGTRASREAAAVAALGEWLDEFPDATTQELFDAHFPPNPLPFKRSDLAWAIITGLRRGTLQLSADRHLTRTTSDSSRREDAS